MNKNSLQHWFQLSEQDRAEIFAIGKNIHISANKSRHCSKKTDSWSTIYCKMLDRRRNYSSN
ncbi:MAG: hypothetical protein H6587_13260 [Flavobacteriales bacterium]|nr:hypothetical protein [Flavobacteriales bacterium]